MLQIQNYVTLRRVPTNLAAPVAYYAHMSKEGVNRQKKTAWARKYSSML